MRLWVVVFLLLAAGCTMLTAFNPEGQPCDRSAPAAQQCLEGFHCDSSGKCVKGAFDGGQ